MSAKDNCKENTWDRIYDNHEFNYSLSLPILDDSLLDQSMSDQESAGPEAPTSKPESMEITPASNADSPPEKGRSSENNSKASPPARQDSSIVDKVSTASMNVAASVDETEKCCNDFGGKGFNPSLYGAIKKLRAATMAPRQTGLACDMPRVGSLIDQGTINREIGYYRHVYDNRMNLSFSFEPRCLICHSCFNSPHHILGDVYQPACIVLSDQHFPAALPATHAKANCPIIIRVEDGTLGDLLASFRKTMGKIKLPVGSVIVLCSLSHLARVGAAAYAADLQLTISNIEEDYGNRVRAVHGIPIIGAPLNDSNTVRSLFDILEWLEATDKRSKYQLPDATHMLKELLLLTGDSSDGIGTARLHMKLPAGMRSRETAVFMMGGSSNLATALLAPEVDEAATVLAAMTRELNSEFVVNIDEKPSLSGADLAEAAAGKEDSLTIVIVGGSHASRLAESLGELHPDIIDLSRGGWTIDEDAATAMADELADQLAGISGKAAVIFHPFDNSIYYGRAPSGARIESYKSEGVYHIEGELMTISKDELKDLFETATCMFKAAKQVPTIIMGPVQRYQSRGCCDDPDHITNLEDPDYGANVTGGITALGQYLRQLVWHRRWRNVVVVNTPDLMGISGAFSVEEAAVRLQDVMDRWGDSDPVHPTKTAYDSLAVALMDLIRTKTMGNEEKSSATEGSRGIKRPREEKVGRRPDWTTGTVTAVARAADRSGGSHFHREQSRGGRRGQQHGGPERERSGYSRDGSRGREGNSGAGYGAGYGAGAGSNRGKGRGSGGRGRWGGRTGW